MAYVPCPTPKRFIGTAKQREVMRHILEATDRCEFIYLGELNRKISWGPVHPSSLTTMIRQLEGHGFLRRLYGRERETDVSKLLAYRYGDVDKVRGLKQFIVPTPLAYPVFRRKI